MRIVFGVLSLLVVVTIVSVLSKKQLTTTTAPVAGVSPGATPQQQVQQFKAAAEAAMQQARPVPDDIK